MPDAWLKAKLALRENPWYFKTFYPRKEREFYKARVVRPGFDIVIEGYPRSANTFATFAFQRAQGRELKVGNHFHSSAQFALARRFGVPAMLCLREPVAAAKSFMVFRDGLEPQDALTRYIEFHRRLLTLRDAFVVAPFEEIISDFGASIERLNSRFGTAFSPLPGGAEMQEKVFDDIRRYRERRYEHYQQAFMKDPLKEALPNAEKAAKGQEVLQSLLAPGLESLRLEAHTLYTTLVGSLAPNASAPSTGANDNPT